VEAPVAAVFDDEARWMVKRVVPVAEEARLPPQILLGLAPGALGVGVDGEGRISVEVRW
jgi:hypothetical protein